MKEKEEYATIAHLASVLGLVCAGNPFIVINKLEGYLFDEEEADAIKTCLKEIRK